MISPFVKEYIFEKAKEKNIKIPSDYDMTLETYRQLVKRYGYKLEFRKGRALTFNNLGANAGLLKNSSIVATPEWAFQLIVNNQEADIAFRITLGHELTHKEKQVSGWSYFQNLKYIAWINEVHADFSAAQKMFNNNRSLLLNAIIYKLRYKKEHLQGDMEDYSHPFWARRKYYVENYDFNSELIKQIAQDVNCTNKRLIEKVIDFYDETPLLPKVK